MKEYSHEFAEYLFHTPSDFEKTGGLWIIRAGRNKAKADYQVGPRMIECYSLHFIISGSATFLYGNDTVTLSKGDLFCLFPHQRYSYHVNASASDSDLRMYWLAFDGGHAQSVLKRLGLTPELPYLKSIQSYEHEPVIVRIHNLLREKKKNAGELELVSLLYQLFAHLSEQPSSSLSTFGSVDWLKRAVQYMDTHYMEGITVADVVEVAGVHRSHVYNECIRLLGLSPQHYLTKLRMNRALELLFDHKLSVTEISLSLGYPDLFAFSRAFCKYYGKSPTRYIADRR